MLNQAIIILKGEPQWKKYYVFNQEELNKESNANENVKWKMVTKIIITNEYLISMFYLYQQDLLYL